MSYVYRRTETNCWTVGYYTPDGYWSTESDHATSGDAAKRTVLLNGGRSDVALAEAIEQISLAVASLRDWVSDHRASGTDRSGLEDVSDRLDKADQAIGTIGFGPYARTE